MSNKQKTITISIVIITSIVLAVTATLSYVNNKEISQVRNITLLNSYTETGLTVKKPDLSSVSNTTQASRTLAIDYIGLEAVDQVHANLKNQNFNTETINRTARYDKSNGQCRFVTVIGFEEKAKTESNRNGTVSLISKNLQSDKCNNKGYYEDNSVTEAEFNDIGVEEAEMTLYYN